MIRGCSVIHTRYREGSMAQDGFRAMNEDDAVNAQSHG